MKKFAAPSARRFFPFLSFVFTINNSHNSAKYRGSSDEPELFRGVGAPLKGSKRGGHPRVQKQQILFLLKEKQRKYG